MAESTSGERTPLLSTSVSADTLQKGKDVPSPFLTANIPLKSNFFNVENRILMAGFLVTTSFSFTQVPLFYVFHLMECDVYYDTHPPFTGPGERCSVNEIAAGTAKQFSLLGISTCIFGTMNLFFTGWLIKRIGAKKALCFQTLVPAVRVLLQILGVIAGKQAGMAIIQATQIVTVFGGPAGYILVVNVIIGELVEAARRTGTFGRLQGVIMLGMSVAYITGGKVGDIFGIQMPFKVAFVFFLLSTVYIILFLPATPVPPPSPVTSSEPNNNGILAPLRILKPQLLRLPSGTIKRHHGVIYLCAGIFVGVVATGYAPLLIQMYATAVFDFTQADNGWLMSEFSFVRSLFLVFAFPKIIEWGRSRFTPSIATTHTNKGKRPATNSRHDSEQTLTNDSSPSYGTLPTHPSEIEVHPANTLDTDNVAAPPPATTTPDHPDLTFDLTFLRYSLILDGFLTLLTAATQRKSHIYLAASLIPLASGSAPAAKGVISAMVTPSQRPDALNAVTLVENIATLTTQGVFGFVFAETAQAGKAWLTFYVNAALAVVAAIVLLGASFPNRGETLLDGQEAEDARRTATEGDTEEV